MKILSNNMYLLLVDEEAEIKDKDYIIDENNKVVQILEDIEFINNGISDGVFCKIIAYRKLNKEAKELDLLLLPNPFKEIDYKHPLYGLLAAIDNSIQRILFR